MKKRSIILIISTIVSLILIVFLLAGAVMAKRRISFEPLNTSSSYNTENQDTIAARFLIPQGFARTTANGYGEYIRNLPLLPDKSPVLLYNGQEKSNQSAHAAVIDMSVGERDLQQ